jgi:hypothetical protein
LRERALEVLADHLLAERRACNEFRERRVFEARERGGGGRRGGQGEGNK